MKYFVLTVLCIVFLSKIIVSQQTDLPNLSNKRTGNLNKCQKCRILTNSFKHGLDHTARGKFEGGDAAWEETKLKSYAKSEIRLVEIQEGLCSEVKKHQEHCYSFADEIEQVIEKWFYNEDHDTNELFSWLCIENLKHCCPDLHFGPDCTPCPHDNNDEICNSHGKCDGEGTRFGYGTCICNTGYTGESCDKCAKGFYSLNNLCHPCHKACKSCIGEGPNSCQICNHGWRDEDGVCVDINECESPVICDKDQFCENIQGSFICRQCDKSCKTCYGEGANKCMSCRDTYVLWSSNCLTATEKDETLFYAQKRLLLYLGPFTLAVILCRNHVGLASIIMLTAVVFVYFCENFCNVKIFDIVYAHFN